MSGFFGLLAFVAFVCLIIEFVKPDVLSKLWEKVNGNLSKGKKLGILAVMFLVFSILSSAGSEKKAASNSADASKPASDSAVEAKTESEKPVVVNKVGDTFKTEKFEIKVSSVKARKSVGGKYLNEKAPDGASFICVNFQYKNISPKPTSSAVKIKHLLDPNGTKYNEASGASTYYTTENNFNTKVLSDINPGITIKDGEVFEVANELWKNKGWKAVVDTDDNDVEVSIN